MKRTYLLSVAAMVFAGATPATAQTTDHNAHHPADAQATKSAGQELTDGEVRKVDMETKKITIRHGPIQHLGMPPMTMVFQATDPALLGKVKSGDKIRFATEKSGGAFVVTRIEPAQ
jgi:Cu/Ag efflux protein CusF